MEVNGLDWACMTKGTKLTPTLITETIAEVKLDL